MAFKEAKQTGKDKISIRMEMQGTLIGYTDKALFIQEDRKICIISCKYGTNPLDINTVQIHGDEDVKMYGNRLGITKGRTIHYYDENGRSAGSKNL